MSISNTSIAQLSTHNPKIEAQNTEVNLERRGELIKVYCQNVFVGIALVQQNKGQLHLSDQTKESIKLLTSSTEEELLNSFKSVESLSKDLRTAAIDAKLSSITLFIEQISANPRLKAHITKCDVNNLIDQIEKLEKMDLPSDVRSRLKSCRGIISAFKMDKVLLSHLKENNSFNLRYYNEGIHHGEKKLEKVLEVLAEAEDGPTIVKLEDMHRCGKILKEEQVKLTDIKHGDVVCFERNPGRKFGENAITFAVVDLIEDKPALRIPTGSESAIYIPKNENMKLTRLSLPH